MPVERKVELVEPDDPNRCQATHVNGQCRYKAMEDSKYCPMHGGNKAGEARRKQMEKQYQLGKWQATVEGFIDDDQLKSLRGEIGITRMLLQETVGRCDSYGQLALATPRITALVGQISNLVSNCQRLDERLGLMLDKSKVLDLATRMVEIISLHISDEDVIAKISNEICSAILDMHGKKPNDSA